LLLCPIDVGRKTDQLLVDIDTTDTGAAAQGRVKNLDIGHGVFLWKI